MRSLVLVVLPLLVPACGLPAPSRPQEAPAFYEINRTLAEVYHDRQLNLHKLQLEQFSEVAEKFELNIFTYNVGLLNTNAASVPEYRQRSELFHTFLRRLLAPKDSPDVVFLQELWHKADIANMLVALNQILEDGQPKYQAAVNSVEKHGLQVLIRSQKLKPTSNSAPIFTEFPSTFIPWGEYTLGYRRGLLSWNLRHNSGRTFNVSTTHLSPYPYVTNDNKRIWQAQRVAGELRTKSTDVDFVVFGADLNSGFEIANIDTDREDWKLDHRPFNSFADGVIRLNFVDTFRVINPLSPGYTQDRRKNPLTFAGYEAEPEQRLDFIFVGSSAQSPQKFVTKRSKLAFDKPFRDFNNRIRKCVAVMQPHRDSKTGLFEISAGLRGVSASEKADLFFSDHFGVQSIVQFAAK